MKKIILFAIVLFAANTAFSQIIFEKGTVAEVLAKGKAENKVIMVDVLTEWCKWCIELDNKVYAKTEVSDFANAKQVNYKIDAEVGEGVDFAKKYGVNGYPTILFLNPDGVEIDRIVGYMPAKDFLVIMEDYNKGINTYEDLKAKLEKNPDDIEANLKYGDKLMTLGKDEDAKIHFTRIVENDANNSAGKTDDAKFRLASLAGKDNALPELEKFVSENQSSDILNEAYVSVSEQYGYGKKDFAAAEKWYQEALAKFPDNDYVRSSYGQFKNYEASQLAEKKDAVEDDYKQGLAMVDIALPYVMGSVNEASSYFIQSKLYFNMKDYAKAMESVDKALKIFNRKLYRDHKEKIEKQLTSK